MVMKSLSVVIPAYNESQRIKSTVDIILKYLKNWKIKFEIIVVDDGSIDNTVDEVKKINKKNIRLIKNGRNYGKGYSEKNGILNSRYEYVLFSDADLSTPIDMLDRFEKYIDNYDIVIGSRALSGSDIKIKQPFYREFMGKIFNKFVRLFTVRGINDTQCGFKLFKGNIAKKIFERATLDGFGFDVEILYIAKLNGIKIIEVPVIWRNSKLSKVRPIKDAVRMFKDLFIIRINKAKGKYYF
ncbi:MAG: dolichyl-phosphate beta-glucosyltransferase [Nanoarchaeota archaeon]